MPRLARLLLLLHLPLIGGCAGLYFHDAGTPPETPPRYALSDLPYDEYWTGLVFNGDKIGFTRLRVEPHGEREGLYRLRGRAVMHFRFLAIDKRVDLESDDVVRADLGIESMRGRYDLDGNRLEVEAARSGDTLEVTVRSRDEVHRESVAIGDSLYPASAIALYPIVHGLEVGRAYSYEVYDAETQSISTVTQEVLDYETSDLFEGRAYKIHTRLHGQEATTWMNEQGLPMLQMSMSGILIAGLEDEATARRYLTRAALNKQESLLEFSRVPATPGIPEPRSVRALVVDLHGLGEFAPPSDGLQRCRRRDDGTRCEIQAGSTATASATDAYAAARYLRSTVAVPSRHKQIRELAREIVGSEDDRRAQIALIVDWIDDNVEDVAIDSFSALDVLATRKAECQGNSYLYAALARSLGIPTRVVNGLVYSELQGGGFYYHTWAESRVDAAWVPVDPTFGQRVADATHIKLIEGESPDELVPLLGLFGRIEATVVSVMREG